MSIRALLLCQTVAALFVMADVDGQARQGTPSNLATNYIEALNSRDPKILLGHLRKCASPAAHEGSTLEKWVDDQLVIMAAIAPLDAPILVSREQDREVVLTRSAADGYWYRWRLYLNERRDRFTATRVARSLGPAAWTSETYSAAASLDELARRAVEQLGLPSLAVAVIRSAGHPTVGVAGVRRLGSGAAVEPGDSFHVGSCTKAMTATIAAALVSAGMVEWHTSIAELADGITIARAYRDVTLEQLLRHRSGMGRNWHTERGFESFADVCALYRDWQGSLTELRADISSKMLCRAPRHEPGQARYSNVGYTVAGHLLERRAGVAWERLAQAHVFEPAGMQSAGFGWPAGDGRSEQPWGHKADEEWTLVPQQPENYPHPFSFAPAGNVRCSVGDLARFVQLHLRGLEGELDHLDPTLFERMHAPTRGADGPSGAGMGWNLNALSGKRVHSHAGTANRFYALMLVIPEDDVGVTLATNTQLPSGEHAAILELVANAAIQAVTTR